MSYTRKVTTYGKKKTSIYTVRPDLTPEPKRTTKSKPMYVDSDSDDATITPAKPLKQSRPPLTTLISSQNVAAVVDDGSVTLGGKEKGKGKGNAPKKPIIDLSYEAKPQPRRAVGVRRVAPPTSAALATPVRSKEVFDCIEVSSRARSGLRKSIVDVSEITEELDELQLSPSKTAISPSSPTSTSPSPLETLLRAASSQETHDFDYFLTSNHLLDLLPSRAQPSFSKIGEASYSEVFSVQRGKQELVIKVVPLLPVRQREGTDEVPDCSSPEDVLREVEITKTLAGLPSAGFVDIRGTFVVHGTYPQRLIDEWYSFRELYGTSSIRPEYFDRDQLYALIVLGDGGHDLESFKFDKTTAWVQASGIFWQVVDALALAEEACAFEHRDLHEGQVLIAPCPTTSSTDMKDPGSTGVKVTIIDFGLSRLEQSSGDIISSAMPSEVFEGQGAQWDVYRALRDVVGSDWAAFKPITNVMWLRYILQYLLHSKSILKPRMPKIESRMPSSPVRTRRIPLTKRTEGKEAFDARAIEAWETLKRMEGLLDQALNGQTAVKTKPRRGAKVGNIEPLVFASAASVLQYGKNSGWVA